MTSSLVVKRTVQ